MNKKLLFATMSLAALAACTNDDFESQKVAEEASPVQFEVINNNDALTRASMNGNTIVWNANDNDLFTLYHGAATLGDVTGYENATFKANANPGGTATLTTPSMIKQGGAIMVWPVDTTFRITASDKLTITIPETLENIENNIPYVSDLVNIGAFTELAANTVPGYNTAGKDRKYPVYMRPMASQLTVKADYNNSDATLAQLYEGGSEGLTGEDAIKPISVTSVALLTDNAGSDKFTKTIPVQFNDPTTAITAQWAGVANNAWSKVTAFNVTGITSDGEQVAKLTTKSLIGNESSKFLILPQATIASGVDKGAVEVNTYYGKVLIAKSSDYPASKYTDDEYNKAWYRYVSAATIETTEENASTPGTGEFADKFKVVAKNTALGMQQTINDFSGHVSGSGIVKDEPVGYALTRYVNVNLSKLDMSDLHITSDKQLRDVARVWKKLSLDPVTVYLDGGKEGDAAEEFTITQHTIDVINTINGGALNFKVKPCQVTGEKCTKVIITGNSGNATVKNIAFIAPGDGAEKVDVVLANEATEWNWAGTVKVGADAVTKIINKGTMKNAATATLKTVENDGTQNDILLKNEGTWNITAGTLNVQFDVTNYGSVNISKGAQYRQDGTAHVFTNEATTLPTRFTNAAENIGKVENKGVFATVDNGTINNYGLIEHADEDAKTYVTSNQLGGNFSNAFAADNKMGRINLPFSNKDEDNLSISAALDQGFVSVTIDGEITDGILNTTAVGSAVNYVIVKSGIKTISNIPAVTKYVEINEPGTEIAWAVPTWSAAGLMVLSDVNIKRGTTVTISKATYLGADMYVGGTFTNTGYVGYYGDTSGNEATKYITY